MDHHVDGRITDGLKDRGVDLLTAYVDGSHELPDEDLLARATTLGRVLVTSDENFHGILSRCWSEGIEFAGCVFIQPLRLTIGECIDRLELIAKASSPDDYWNRMDYLAEY